MAQKGNDWQKDGAVSSYPDNKHDGVVSSGENYTPLSMVTDEDGDPMYRGPHSTNYSGWALPGNHPE